MTTNDQIKCPRCESAMKQNDDEIYMDTKGAGFQNRADYKFVTLESNLYQCTNEDCKDYGVERCILDIEEMNEIIQSRIDKEKAAAVQEERERVDKDLERMEIFYKDNCPQNKLSCHATILSTIKEARKVVVKGVQQFNMT